jgi:hypothetical protein
MTVVSLEGSDGDDAALDILVIRRRPPINDVFIGVTAHRKAAIQLDVYSDIMTTKTARRLV